MRVKSLRIENFRSIDEAGPLSVGPITVVVGPNNSGKSAFLACFDALQDGSYQGGREVRVGADAAIITFELDQIDGSRHWDDPSINAEWGTIRAPINRNGLTNMALATPNYPNSERGISRIKSTQRAHFIIPYLSGRRVGYYQETINETAATEVRRDFMHLTARVDMLMDRNHPKHDQFFSLLNDVIGLPISTVPTANGKKVGMWVNTNDRIHLEEMGAGVAQLLGFIVDLCLAEKQLFIVEELENDLHPAALKTILRTVIDAATDNQFVFSTHSNVVLRELGSVPETVIYETSSTISNVGPNRLTTTTIQHIGNDPESRMGLLTKLGYELSDLDLWDGWLILEESSAETLIKTYFVAWFAPGLARVRTIAAQGTGDVERSFSTLYTLTLYTHLEPRYRNRFAVIVDGDLSGKEAIAKLRTKFRALDSRIFDNFDANSFEEYYPSEFSDEVAAALSTTDRSRRRVAKNDLLKRVLAWIQEDEERARLAFKESARDVIEKLQAFEQRFST